MAVWVDGLDIVMVLADEWMVVISIILDGGRIND